MEDKKKKIGRPTIVFSDENRQIIANAARIGMRNEDIVLLLQGVKDISVKTLKRNFQELLTEERGKAKYAILKTLYKMATSGQNTAATIFAAKTMCGINESHYEKISEGNIIDESDISDELKIDTKDPLEASKKYIEIMRGDKK